MADKKLTAKQEMFCKEYLIDLNATQAAIRAGYSENRASEIGYQQLQKTTIKDRIQKELDKRSQETDITAAYVLKTIKDTVEAAKEEGKHSDTLRGAELLGKHLKMFTDKIESKLSGDLTINWPLPKTKLDE
jgi:phage terminase small subunit